MVEKNHQIEQYARMSPQERNVDLIRLYEQLPVSGTLSELMDPDISDELKWPEDKRAVSEHKRIIMGRLEELLRYSALTDMGKTVFQEEFSLSYDVGVYKHIPEADAEGIRALGEKVGLDSEETGELREMILTYSRIASRQRAIFFAMFDSDDPDSGGIFDPERAPLLERQFYGSYKDYYSSLRRVNMDVAVEHAVGGMEDRRVGEMAKKEYQRLEKWAEQLGIFEEETGER